MKKIGNRPITEADTDFSKLQKKLIIIKKKNQESKIKNQKSKILGKFWDFFPPFFTAFILFSYKEVCDYFFYFMNLMNSMFIKHM